MTTRRTYDFAREEFASYGVDTDEACAKLAALPISLHCWQGDDVTGFEVQPSRLTGGILATGAYPGKARNGEELRNDLDKALQLIPGSHRVNVHALYAETHGKTVERTDLKPEHFSSWVEWAKKRKLGLDFNPSFFSHPKAESGFTLSHQDAAIRQFWIDHAIACRRIGEYFGKQLKTPCVTNIWIPDGYKDTPADRYSPRKRLGDSLDAILAERIDPAQNLDAVESKLFGIGSESYVVGSHEFYMGYAARKAIMLCLDSGHFHPTESIADKISSILTWSDRLLLHVSRGVRWDSDHIVVLNDEIRSIAEEVVRGGFLNRVHVSLDYFDASVNRIAAWVIGMRATQKAFLSALLQPHAQIRRFESEGNHTGRLALMEEAKSLPMGAVWDHFCEMHNVPIGMKWFDEVQSHERTVLSLRTASCESQRSDLILISHFLGSNAAYVQAGGGNTSVKCNDGTMLIKASGSSMAAMSNKKGWVRVKMDTIRSMFEDTELIKLPYQEREKRALSYLHSSIIEPRDARPSVETPLHILLRRVVMHSHPVAANALTCSTNGEALLRAIEGPVDAPALWVPYVDPGSTLAFAISRLTSDYQRTYKTIPRVIFLQNHGFFCNADTVQECIDLHMEWMNRLENHFRRVTDSLCDVATDATVRSAIEKICASNRIGKLFVVCTNDRSIRDVLISGSGMMTTDALTPDQVVYAGPRPLVLDESVSEKKIVDEFISFKNTYHQLPRIIIVRNKGVWIVAESPAKAEAAEAITAASTQTYTMACGAIRGMIARDVDFILNWEAEHYRAKQV